MVLRKAFSYVACSHTDNRVVGQIVVNLAVKDFNPDGAFFDLLGLAGQSFIDDKPEKSWVPFAAAEWRAQKNPLQLGTYFLFHQLIDGRYLVVAHFSFPPRASRTPPANAVTPRSEEYRRQTALRKKRVG